MNYLTRKQLLLLLAVQSNDQKSYTRTTEFVVHEPNEKISLVLSLYHPLPRLNNTIANIRVGNPIPESVQFLDHFGIQNPNPESVILIADSDC